MAALILLTKQSMRENQGEKRGEDGNEEWSIEATSLLLNKHEPLENEGLVLSITVPPIKVTFGYRGPPITPLSAMATSHAGMRVTRVSYFHPAIQFN